MKNEIQRYNVLLNVEGIKGLVFIIGLFFLMINTTHASSDINMPICKKIRKILAKNKGWVSSKKYYIENEYIDDGDTLYKNIDLDNDKIDDYILRSCGASYVSICSLFIDTSSGIHLELEEARFYLMQIKLRLYIVTGDTSEPEEKKRGTRQVYKITKESINMICSNI